MSIPERLKHWQGFALRSQPFAEHTRKFDHSFEPFYERITRKADLGQLLYTLFMGTAFILWPWSSLGLRITAAAAFLISGALWAYIYTQRIKDHKFSLMRIHHAAICAIADTSLDERRAARSYQ